MEKIISNAVIGVMLILAAFILRPKANAPVTPPPVAQFELVSDSKFVYRLNKVSGRTDVVFPGPDGVFLIPIWQMNPSFDDASKAPEDERARWNNISKLISAYLNGAKVNFASAETPASGNAAAPAQPKS